MTNNTNNTNNTTQAEALALIAFLADRYPEATAAELFDALCDGEALSYFATCVERMTQESVELAADMMDGPDGDALLSLYRK